MRGRLGDGHERPAGRDVECIQAAEPDLWNPGQARPPPARILRRKLTERGMVHGRIRDGA
jgi:hypothetical protein